MTVKVWLQRQFKQISFYIHPDYFLKDPNKYKINQESFLTLKTFLDWDMNQLSNNMKENLILWKSYQKEQLFYPKEKKDYDTIKYWILAMDDDLKLIKKIPSNKLDDYFLFLKQKPLIELSEKLDIKVDKEILDSYLNKKRNFDSIKLNRKDRLNTNDLFRIQFLNGLKQGLLNNQFGMKDHLIKKKNSLL